jgi:ubiquinone/menaquinone biosynthesis C-methylase UbiE
MRRQVWAFHISIGAVILSVAAIISAHLRWAAVWAVLAVSSWMATRVWNRQDSIPMPYFMRWILFLPRGPHSPQHLKRILQPRSGERILEVGPGVGVHALPIAAALLPSGILDALDIQYEMLDDLKRRAVKAGITNIVATQGDAQALPYPRHTFDAAYMIGTLGEIPDESAALRELRRVLKPTGRLVIGEVLVDPDYVPLPTLEEKARDADLVLERTTGPRFSYFALFRPTAIRESLRVGEVARTVTHDHRIRANLPDPQGLGFIAMLTHRYESSAIVRSSVDKVFAHLDDHTRLSAHMSESSWKMGGVGWKLNSTKVRGKRSDRGFVWRGGCLVLSFRLRRL